MRKYVCKLQYSKYSYILNKYSNHLNDHDKMTGLSFLIIRHNSHGLIIWVLSTTVDCTWQESHDGIQCFPCSDLPNTHKYTSFTIIHKHIIKQHRLCWRKVLLKHCPVCDCDKSGSGGFSRPAPRGLPLCGVLKNLNV